MPSKAPVANVPPQGGRKHPEQQYIQMDTTNVLFICGGTFTGLETIIALRPGPDAKPSASAASRRPNSTTDLGELLLQESLPTTSSSSA